MQNDDNENLAGHRHAGGQSAPHLDRVDALEGCLREIYYLAHAHSTGPSMPDVLWDVRNLAGGVL